MRFAGTAGYADEATILFDRYERRTFEQVHATILHLMPVGGRALDIGAGTGRDAAGLAARGFDVIAVEPTAALREPARQLHPSNRIVWVEDGLPGLESVSGRFDVVLATAVWMHLDVDERAAAMVSVAALVAPKGLLSITLRRGPVPNGRRMFYVDQQETIAQAEAQGLRLMTDSDEPSIGETNRAAGVWWRRVVFMRP